MLEQRIVAATSASKLRSIAAVIESSEALLCVKACRLLHDSMSLVVAVGSKPQIDSTTFESCCGVDAAARAATDVVAHAPVSVSPPALVPATHPCLLESSHGPDPEKRSQSQSPTSPRNEKRREARLQRRGRDRGWRAAAVSSSEITALRFQSRRSACGIVVCDCGDCPPASARSSNCRWRQ